MSYVLQGPFRNREDPGFVPTDPTLDAGRINAMDQGIYDAQAPDVELLLAAGNAAVGDMLPGGLRWHGSQVLGLAIHADTAPTGGPLSLEVKSGATVLGSVSLPAGQTDYQTTVNFAPAAGTRLRFNATAVGATTPAAGVTLSLLAAPPTLANLLDSTQINGTGGITVWNCTYTSDSSVTYGGHNTFRVVSTNTNQPEIDFQPPKAAVSPGLVYSFEAYARNDAGSSQTWMPILYFYDSSNAFIAGSAGTQTTVPGSTFTRIVENNATAPANAAYCQPSVFIVSVTLTVGTIFHLGGARLVQGVLV